MKGVVYIMTTVVDGLIKIGQTGSQNYQERMRNLESNGYYNVSGLKRFFASFQTIPINPKNISTKRQ